MIQEVIEIDRIIEQYNNLVMDKDIVINQLIKTKK